VVAVVAESERDNTTCLSLSNNVPNCAASAARFVCIGIGIVIVNNPLQKGMNNLCVRTERISGGGS
jgi:hypothetical protein